MILDDDQPSLIQRIVADPVLAKELSEYSAGLDNMIDYGGELLGWIIDRNNPQPEDIPIIMILRHILEQLDAISILISNAAIEPCKILLRASLEAYLGLRYMLIKDTKRRAMAYMVCWLHKKIKDYALGSPSTLVGKQFRALKRKDSLVGARPVKDVADADENLAEVEVLLQQPIYIEAEAAYQDWHKQKREDKKKGKNQIADPTATQDEGIAEKRGTLNWYSLFGGPPGFEQLVQELHHEMLYETMYRPWSELVHGSDVLSGKLITFTHGYYVSAIREGQEADRVTANVISILLKLYELLTEQFVPEKQVTTPHA